MRFSMYLIAFESLVLLLISMGSSSVKGKIVDLTHPLNSRSIHFPIFRDFELQSAIKGNQDQYGGIWVEANDISMNEHTGTHVDAPVHTWETGIHINEIPAEDLIGPAVVIDVNKGKETSRDYLLTVQDIKDFEKAHGRIPDRAVVFLYSCGAKDYTDHKKYLGTATPNDPSTMHFPGFSQESIEWLVSERNIRGIGTDRMSFDAGQNENLAAHIALLSRGKFGVENTNNLDKLPAIGSTVYVMPLPFEGGSGSPARIVAVIDETNAASGLISASLGLMTLMTLFVTILT